jgi:transcriptional antiterminator RfaH
MTAGSHWYVVHTQPNNERRADINLRRQGFVTYLPLYQRIRRHARQTALVERPLFPRYLFIALDLSFDRWGAVHSTFGVSNLVSAGEEPLAIPDGVVDEIRTREGNDGFITLGLPPGIRPGSRIRLIDGIFADAHGVLERISDQNRVAVLLNLLGREVRVSVQAANIAAA